MNAAGGVGAGEAAVRVSAAACTVATRSSGIQCACSPPPHSPVTPRPRSRSWSPTPPAQPVPMVGLVKDSDAPARKPFQWNGTFNQTSGVGGSFKVTTVPPNQRLVNRTSFWKVQFLWGYLRVNVSARFWAHQLAVAACQLLDRCLFTASTPVRFYVNPGMEFNFSMSNFSPFTGSCNLSASGYYVDLP